MGTKVKKLLLVIFIAGLSLQTRPLFAQVSCDTGACDTDADCAADCGTCWACIGGPGGVCTSQDSRCQDMSGGLSENICRNAVCTDAILPDNPTGCDYSVDLTATDPQCILCEAPSPPTQPSCGDGACELDLGENCENCPVDCLVPGFDLDCPRFGPIPPDQQCFGPSLGLADTFGILASTYTNTIGSTTINGDLGYTTPPATNPTVNGTTFVSDVTYNGAGTDQGTALTALGTQACTFTFPAGAVDLATETTHGTLGVYTPGVYCTTATSAASIGTAGITLNGSGTYIFRINGALTSVANSNVNLTGGASACNVWWTPTGATTLGANTTFTGTIIDDSGITIGDTVTLTGRALAFGGTVSTNNDTITVPPPPPPPDPPINCDPVPGITFPGPPFTGTGDAACEDGDLCTQSACNPQGICEPQTVITACSGSFSDLCCPAFCVPFDATDPGCSPNNPSTLCDADCILPQYCPFCGNNIIDPNEECDGTATNNCGAEGCNDATCQCNPPTVRNDCLQGSGFGNNSGKAPGDCGGWSGCSLGRGTSVSGFLLPLSAMLLGIILFQRRNKRYRGPTEQEVAPR